MPLDGAMEGVLADSWVPQPGSQALFMSSHVFEALYHGTRGNGKTDTLLMDFAQHVGRGFGAAWRGVLFRQTYPQLADAIAKSKRWFYRIFPGADFNVQSSTWKFPDGEELLLRHMRTPDDYWNYHGHEYPWIGWEELTNWPNDSCYRVMMTCCRSSHPGVPRKYRATTNPYGVGHNWIKARFRLPGMNGRIIRTPGEPDRVAIQGFLWENLVLVRADPHYVEKIVAGARNKSEREAWLTGSWDIVAGGMFDDVFDARVHVVRPFAVPRSWHVDRAFDWGSSKPYSYGLWAESDGTDVERPDGTVVRTVRGDLFRIGELYGWGGQPNVGTRETASGIASAARELEARLGLAGRVQAGPADASIFDEENGNCIAADFAAAGVRFARADKGPGSRRQGWEAVRKRLLDSRRGDVPRERPGLFVFDTCEHWLRTVPVLPRDDRDLDDVDSDAEDHAGDETRYRVRHERRGLIVGRSR